MKIFNLDRIKEELGLFIIGKFQKTKFTYLPSTQKMKCQIYRQYEDSQGRSLITDNPVKRLSQTRAWYRVERSQSFIKSHELADWYASVQKLTNDILRDYLLLILFTGLRRLENDEIDLV